MRNGGSARRQLHLTSRCSGRAQRAAGMVSSKSRSTSYFRHAKERDGCACPFECCTYRAWNTKADTVAYAKPDANAKVVGLLKAGGTVEAITGEVHATPVRFVVKKAHAEYKPGDVLWVYTYLGEGNTQSVAGWRNAGRRSRLQPLWRLPRGPL